MRAYKSKVIKSFLESNPGESNPELIIKQKANDLIESYFSFSGEPQFPINMEVLASFSGINVKKTLMSPDIAGQLVYDYKNNQLNALVNKSENEYRQNFTIGHEISHTFFPGYKTKKFRAEKVRDLWGSIDDEEEYLCDLGASELLMPRKYSEQKLNEFGFSIKSLPLLSEHFGASLEATAVKMVSLTTVPCCILVCEKSLKQSELIKYGQSLNQLVLFNEPIILPQEKLRVKYAIRSEQWDSGFIPRQASISEDCSIFQASQTNESINNKKEKIKIKGFQGNFNIETYALKNADDEVAWKTFTLLIP